MLIVEAYVTHDVLIVDILVNSDHGIRVFWVINWLSCVSICTSLFVNLHYIILFSLALFTDPCIFYLFRFLHVIYHRLIVIYLIYPFTEFCPI